MSFDFDKAEEQFEDFNRKWQVTPEQREANERMTREVKAFVDQLMERMLPESRLTQAQSADLQESLLNCLTGLPRDIQEHLLKFFTHHVAQVTIDPL